eukprot:CAMPEP_0204117288 /NCGR_PEP_ID=MMETSP0361-20130328/5891_1 /ASSEMBLY_ACC=CAM_ASM_000343 /TAXON_ID=268821 /ORGANISM="Scrippsiella Hangoei, Strain SHTV-5" /LENGTH=306 /DNA_ID=CAMNT_0051068175 /DNA_START=1 /DNA_END=921 /DNA_ORIENTATION=+
MSACAADVSVRRRAGVETTLRGNGTSLGSDEHLGAFTLSWALVVYLATCSTGLKPFLTLTDRKSWAWELTAFGYFLKVAQDNREKLAGYHWAKVLTATGIAAFGGGLVLAPLIVAMTPVPLIEEIFLWMVVVSCYIVHNLGPWSDVLSALMKVEVSKQIFTVFFGIFKTQQIVGGLELAAKAVAAGNMLPHSAYFPTALAAPWLCGFVGGCGGAFLPFANGLAPIEEDKVWNISAAFLAPLAYLIMTRFCGVDMLTAKMTICVFRILGDLFPGPRDNLLRPLKVALYKGTNVRSTPLPTVVPVKKT